MNAIRAALFAAVITVCTIVLTGCSKSNQVATPASTSKTPELVLVESYPGPVLTINSPGAEGVTYGFEGGQVIKLENTYHLITVEFIQNPIDPTAYYTRTNIAHWISTNRINWERVGTLLASTGNRSGTDPRSVYGGPMPVYNEQLQRWELFYVGYRSQPMNSPYPPAPGKSDPNPYLFPVNVNFHQAWNIYYQYSGRLFRAASQTSGLDGISGPYEEIQTVLETSAESQPWEGLYGDDSFEPYQVGEEWFALFGSAHTEGGYTSPYSGRLMVGLAASSSRNGPWTRLSGNPLTVEPKNWENPVICHCASGFLTAVYNAPGWPTFDIGYTSSTDGVHWSDGQHLTIEPDGVGWAASLRTPLGLVPEPDGTFTIFYTGATALQSFTPSYHMAVSYVIVRLE
jgi:hypothetical protein